MADDEFSFNTDNDDDRAVEDILSQALDHSVLEQIAAINCSSFSTTDNLPSHLETRFRKLKSLPATATAAASRFPPAKSKSLTPRSDGRYQAFHDSVDSESPEEDSDGIRNQRNGSESKLKSNSKLNANPEGKVRKQKDIEAKSGTDSPSSAESLEHSESKSISKSKSDSNSKLNRNPEAEVYKRKDLKAKSGSDSWSLSESESGTLSPPRRKIGCLWCSPKKEKSVSNSRRKQGKENRLWSSSSSPEFLKTFSMKEQKKIMKKAMKEEEKINREAEKIVKWAKQASARMMDVSGLDDDFSDIENSK